MFKANRTLQIRYGIVALLAVSVLGGAACGAVEPTPAPPPIDVLPTPVPPAGNPGAPVIPEQPAQPTEPARGPQVAGTYAMESAVDIGPALPANVLNIIDTVHEVAEDPAGFILDQAISRLDDGFLKSALDTGRDLAAPLINQWIEDHVPELVNDIRNVAIAIGDAVHNLQFGSQLVLTADAGQMPASHYIDTFHFDYNGERISLSIADLGERSVASAEGFTATVNGTELVIGEHALTLNYGEVVIGMVNKLLIPRLAPGATNLGELLVQKINCESLGETISDAISLISADVAAGACDLGLQFGAGFLSSKIESLALETDAIKLSGSARISDANGDLTYDSIQGGHWTVKVAIGGSETTLAADTDVFSGGR